jgi:hypothetical protein
LLAGIPVYVTCTGGDLGLASQCSEIAAGTGGFYVDSEAPARLPEAFVDFHARIWRKDPIHSFTSWEKPIAAGVTSPAAPIYVEKGCESVTFTLIWQDPKAKAAMSVVDPKGKLHQSRPLPQGRFVRVRNPIPGDWRMRIDWSGGRPEKYVMRAYSRNRLLGMAATVRHKNVLPGQPIYVYASPCSVGRVTAPGSKITATVRRPDGKRDVIELADGGRRENRQDDVEKDGTFTGVYTNTKVPGPYQFLLRAEVDGWQQSFDCHERDPKYRSPRFAREVRLSAAVGDPKVVEREPEDGKVKPSGKR